MVPTTSADVYSTYFVKEIDMKSLAFLAAALIASGSAFAGQVTDKDELAHTPVPLTEAQMDNVTAGALVNAVLVDVVDVRNIQVAVPVDAAVAAGILGNAGAITVQHPGRQEQ
jgi:hypothetical protein